MEMVAAVKLRRFQDFLESTRPYTEKVELLLNRILVESGAGYFHPFLEKKKVEGRPSKLALVLFTSDTGLCGTYNSELENRAKKWLQENSQKETSFVFVGKHGANALRQSKSLATFTDLRVGRVDEILDGLRQIFEETFLNSKVDEIWAAYSRMESLSRYDLTIEKILPIERRPTEETSSINYLLEPDIKRVLDRLVPAFFEAKLRFIFYHALLTEQIARMSAMRQATQNAEEMIDELTLLRNKARQAAITKEIIEVVSGSRALKLK